MRDLTVYRDRHDWWVGVYLGSNHVYLCPLPTVVIRWKRRPVFPPRNGALLGCGHWTAAVQPGQCVGELALCTVCGHRPIVRCNVDEPDA